MVRLTLMPMSWAARSLGAGAHGLPILLLRWSRQSDDDTGHHSQQRHIGDPQLAAEEGSWADDRVKLYGVSAEQDLSRVLQKSSSRRWR